MCGIWGFIGANEKISTDQAWDGLCKLTDRGPDDWGLYINGIGKVTNEENIPSDNRYVVLGNRRLSILDLSAAGNQPIGSEEDGLWIIYNGEVYNYREIRNDLRDLGYTFTSDSDTEVILRAYQEYGEECVNRFRGMFAFAIYDTEREIVFGARDRFGIKPFYYNLTQNHFAFASEVTSLLEANVVSPELDPVSVDGFLTFGYVPGPRTIIDGIESLPPGTTIVYNRNEGTCNINNYWTPEFDGKYSGSAKRVRGLLKESVNLRLRSDVPVGAFLSGGLDSSSIVALMREVGGETREDLHTFSIGFEQEGFSETEFAESVADSFDTHHISQTVTATEIRERIDDIIDAMDQPSIDGVNTYFVSQLAANNDLKVVLSGLGSDELLYGYPSFERVPQRYQVAKWFYTLPEQFREWIGQAIGRFGSIINPSKAGKIEDAIGSATPFGAAYLSERGVFSRRQRQKLLKDRWVETDWSARLEDGLTETDGNVRDGVSYTELMWYMHYQLLRDTDVMAMSHSLEVRVPFLDTELAEYVMRSTADSKSVGQKKILKESVGDIVPLNIIEREKSGFVFPFAKWLKDDLVDIVNSALSAEALAETPISRSSAMDIRQAYENGNEHWSRVWALVVLSLWIDHHLPRK